MLYFQSSGLATTETVSQHFIHDSSTSVLPSSVAASVTPTAAISEQPFTLPESTVSTPIYTSPLMSPSSAVSKAYAFLSTSHQLTSEPESYTSFMNGSPTSSNQSVGTGNQGSQIIPAKVVVPVVVAIAVALTLVSVLLARQHLVKFLPKRMSGAY